MTTLDTLQRSVRTLFPVLACLVLVGAGAHAQCFDYSDAIHWSGRISTSGAPRHLVWHDGYLYAAGDHLDVIDARDPDSAYLLRTVPTPGYVQDVAADDGYLYVADAQGGLQVMTHANPAWPWILAALPEATVGNLISIAIDGNRLLAGDNQGRIHLIDVTDPTHPLQRAVVSIGTNCAGLAIQDDIVYAALYSGGVAIIRIAQPNQLLHLATVSLTWAYGVAISQGRLYVAAYNDGLVIYDLDDPVAPVELGRLVLPDSAVDVAIDGDRVFVAHDSPGLVCVDASDPSAPFIVSTHAT